MPRPPGVLWEGGGGLTPLFVLVMVLPCSCHVSWLNSGCWPVSAFNRLLAGFVAVPALSLGGGRSCVVGEAVPIGGLLVWERLFPFLGYGGCIVCPDVRGLWSYVVESGGGYTVSEGPVRGRFVEGNPGDRGAPKPPRCPRLLLDMRAVYRGGSKEGESVAVQRLRRMFEEDPKGFFSQMTSLEDKYLVLRSRRKREEVVVRAPVVEEPAPIVGGPRKGEGHPVVRLIDELLEEIGVREGAEGGGG